MLEYDRIDMFEGIDEQIPLVCISVFVFITDTFLG